MKIQIILMFVLVGMLAFGLYNGEFTETWQNAGTL
jgi:hypothetical protein